MRTKFFSAGFSEYCKGGCLERVDISMSTREYTALKHEIFSPSTLRMELVNEIYSDLTFVIQMEQYGASNRFKKVAEAFVGKHNSYVEFIPAFTNSKVWGTRISYAMLFKKDLDDVVDYERSLYVCNSDYIRAVCLSYDKVKDMDIFWAGKKPKKLYFSNLFVKILKLAGIENISYFPQCYERNGKVVYRDPELTPKRVLLKPGNVFRIPNEGGLAVYAQFVADDPLQLNSQIVRVVVSDTELTAKKVAQTESAFFAHLYLKAAVEAWDWGKIGSANISEDALDGITFYEGEDVMMVDNDHIEHVDPLDNVDTWKHGDTDRLHLGKLPAGEGLRLEDATIVPPPYIAYRAIHGKYPHSIHDCHPTDFPTNQ